MGGNPTGGQTPKNQGSNKSSGAEYVAAGAAALDSIVGAIGLFTGRSPQKEMPPPPPPKPEPKNKSTGLIIASVIAVVVLIIIVLIVRNRSTIPALPA